ncbi:hypothetical protein SDC9_64748 [bioreactor metagenome]|uniref:Uncharacterized protein n=1 Tax=bioreactor metagenome TaxID=1076179 RepID=A0A644XQB4_9ZZZZ
MFRFFVVQESTSPTFSRTQHVGIGETTTEYNHIDIFQRFPSRCQVGHVYIFHIETGQIKRISHLTITIGSFFTDDSSFNSTWLSILSQSELRKFTFKAFIESECKRLVFIIIVTCLCAGLATLFSIQQIRRAVPHIPQIIDGESICNFFLLNFDPSFFDGSSNTGKTNTIRSEHLFNLFPVFHLNQHARILSKQVGNQRIPFEVIEFNRQPAFGITKTHFQQGGDHTSF